MQATFRLRSFLKPYWLSAILAPLLMMLEVAMDLLQPRMIQHIIDEGIAQTDMSVVYRIGPAMVLVAIIGLVGGLGCTVFSVLASQGVGTDIRSTLFARVQALSFQNLDELETGKLITRLTNDVTQVQQTVLIMLRMMVRAPLIHIGSLIMAVITAPQLAVLYIVLIPIEVIAMFIIVRRAFPLFSKVQRRLDALNTVVQENLAGVRVVKAFVRERFEIQRFAKSNDDLTDMNISAIRTVAFTMPFMMIVMNAGIVAALWLGGVNVNAGSMQVGQIIAFINYLTMTLMSLMMLSMIVMRISRAEASAVRIHEVLDSEPAIENKDDAIMNSEAVGRVEFEDVTFSYGEHEEEPVLTSVSFTAEPGETVAVMGATGSGKTSLVHLIPRFYDVDSGRITVDHMDVRDMDKAALRSKVGVAMQESVLFSGSIRDNIRYGRPDASDEQVIAAAKMAQAHDFITGFPEGYDSVVGQRGVNLSGGQKQRIAIARALLTQPAVLILDDSTSSVDMETEALIQEALSRPENIQTKLVVAQRISTVLGADKILVLEDGKVAALGTHEELLRTSPIYQEIYDSQIDAPFDDIMRPENDSAGSIEEANGNASS